MKTVISLLLALAVVASVTVRAEAQAENSETSTDMSPNQPKYLEQMDREGRGGQGQG